MVINLRVVLSVFIHWLVALSAWGLLVYVGLRDISFLRQLDLIYKCCLINALRWRVRLRGLGDVQFRDSVIKDFILGFFLLSLQFFEDQDAIFSESLNKHRIVFRFKFLD